MHKKFYNSLVLELSILPKSPLLIKAGGLSADPSLPDMQFVRTHVADGEDTIYIPGSSFKGVVRSYVERILKTLKEGSSCDPLENPCSNGIAREASSQDVYKGSCMACKIFGNTCLKSRIVFTDAYPIDEVVTETRHGVAISRLTQAAVRGALFEFEVVVEGGFRGRVQAANFQLWQLGLLTLAFEAMNNGLVKMGFGKNRGFGEVEIKVERAEFTFSKAPPPDEIWGAAMFASKEEIEGYGLEAKDKIKIKAESSASAEDALFVRRVYETKDWEKIADALKSLLREVL